MKPIAHIRSPFPAKFGIPRQPMLVPDIVSEIVFLPEFRQAEAFRGLEEYSHIWLIWEFSENKRESWSPTVRPPRLGGNKRMGVFATRSPFRPNPVGLSLAVLHKIDLFTKYGPVLYVKGCDLMDGTPIFDIKPYLPHIEAIPEARAGFSAKAAEHCLSVHIPHEVLDNIPEMYRNAVAEILRQDPRPSYQNDPDRVYGFQFGGMEIKFKVTENTASVISAERL